MLKRSSLDPTNVPLNVLHVITTIEFGGAEKALLTLVKAQVKRGLAVSVIGLKGNPELREFLIQSGAKYISSVSNRPFILQVLEVRKRVGDFDILHCHLPRAEILGAIARRATKLVITKHNSESFYPSGWLLLSRAMSYFVAKRSYRIICISNAVKKFLEEISEIPKNSDKVKVVHYGIDAQLDTERTFSLKDTLTIGTISRLVSQKNLEFLIDIVLEIKSLKRKINCLILGDGPDKEKLQDKIDRCGLEDDISILPKSPNINQFLSELDVFVLASKYEGFGMVLLEAMQSQIPIVSSNVSAIPEVLGEDHPGLAQLDNVHDFVSKILNLAQPQFSASTVELQNKRLHEFTVNKYESKVFDLYRIGNRN